MKTQNNQTNKSKKGMLLLSLTSLFLVANSQDILTLKNGDELKVKVIEINDTEIKYKKFESMELQKENQIQTDSYISKNCGRLGRST